MGLLSACSLASDTLVTLISQPFPQVLCSLNSLQSQRATTTCRYR